jgi:hypothetical protein
MNSSRVAQIIQKMPASPNMVMMGMILSITPHCRWAWIQSKIGRSKATAMLLRRFCTATTMA